MACGGRLGRLTGVILDRDAEVPLSDEGGAALLQRDLLAIRYLEIESEIAEIHAGRVVDGDPAVVEQAPYLESEAIEDRLSAQSRDEGQSRVAALMASTHPTLRS